MNICIVQSDLLSLFFLSCILNSCISRFLNVHCECGCKSEDLSFLQEILDIDLYETGSSIKCSVSFSSNFVELVMWPKVSGVLWRCFKLNCSLLYFSFVSSFEPMANVNRYIVCVCRVNRILFQKS